MAANARSSAPAPVIRGASVQGSETSTPFWGLMVFTFVLFVAPQTFFPVLHTLRIALVTASLALIVYALDRLTRRQPLTVTVPPVRLLFVFVTLAAVGIPFSWWPGGAFDALFNELLKSLLVFLLVANTVDTPRRTKLMIGSMALWGILMSWTALRNFETGALRGGRIYGYESPLAANPNDLALILNLILALVIGLYYSARKPVTKILLVLAMGLLVSAIVTSYSRGGFLTLLTIAIVFLIKRVRQRGPAVLGWAFVVVLFFMILLPQGYGDRISSIFDSKADDGSADARWNSMVLAWNGMLQHPILGLGLQMHGLGFGDVIGNWNWVGVHNVYLQIGADLGVPALVVYLLALWKLAKGMRESLKRLKGSAEDRELFGLGTGIEIALAAFVVAAFFHPVAYHLYFFYVAGLAVAFRGMAERSRPRGSAAGH